MVRSLGPGARHSASLAARRNGPLVTAAPRGRARTSSSASPGAPTPEGASPPWSPPSPTDPRRADARAAAATRSARPPRCPAAASCASPASPAWRASRPPSPPAGRRRAAVELRRRATPAAATTPRQHRPRRPPRGIAPSRPRRRPPRPSASPAANIPPGWTEHDVAARNVVRRYVGNLAPALKRDLRRRGVRQDRRHARRSTRPTPSCSSKPAFVQVPQLVLTDALDAAQARDRRRVEGLPDHDRRDRAADRRAQADRRRPRLQQADARARRSGSTRATRSARSSPTTSRRRPASTSTASSSTTSSWTASRS